MRHPRAYFEVRRGQGPMYLSHVQTCSHFRSTCTLQAAPPAQKTSGLPAEEVNGAHGAVVRA